MRFSSSDDEQLEVQRAFIQLHATMRLAHMGCIHIGISRGSSKALTATKNVTPASAVAADGPHHFHHKYIYIPQPAEHAH